jgi:hypothetical protein
MQGHASIRLCNREYAKVPLTLFTSVPEYFFIRQKKEELFTKTSA